MSQPRRDPNGTWSFVVDVGLDPEGRRRQTRRRGFPTKRAAQEELDRLRVSITDRVYVPPKRQTIGDFVEEWLATVQRKPSTLESYARNLRLHVVSRIGHLQLAAIDAGTLNRLYADLIDNGRRDSKDGGLSPRTVRYIHTIIGRLLADAVRWGRLSRNAARAAEPPSASSAKPPEMQTWDARTLLWFLECEKAERYHLGWILLATTGMRRGEALGLRWADVDLDAGTASIRQTLTSVNHRLVFADTKTGRARSIRLDTVTVSLLRTWKVKVAEERLVMGAGYAGRDLVLCFPDGRPYDPERFSREFGRRVERHGLDKIRLHDLRHTWATLALQAGVDVKVVSEQLGHASTVITWNTYMHVTPSMQTDAVERVAALIFG